MSNAAPDVDRRIVFITGMFRSGSTWSFNVVKQLLLAAKPSRGVYAIAGSQTAVVLAGAGDAGAIVMKMHKLDAEGESLVRRHRVKVVHTFRDPLAAINSGRRAFPLLEDGLGLVAGSLPVMDVIRASRHGCLVFYDDIVDRPDEMVRRIATHLEVDVPPATVADIVDRLGRDKVRAFTDRLAADRKAIEASRPIVDLAFSYYDGDTLFHRAHIGPEEYEVENSLSAADRAAIINRLQPYLDESGRFLYRQSEFYLAGKRMD